jgi:diguanylate cyclase (GGDEF)-like protein
LVADDDRGMLAAYKAAFASATPGQAQGELAAMAASLFAETAPVETGAPPTFDVTYVDQGADAVAAVEAGLREGRPYQVVFLDMRMPPGIDGKEAARQIRAVDGEINLVIVTGYSDSSPLEVAKVAGPLDKLYYVAKPFEVEEILQLARALSEKWRVEGDLKTARLKLEEQVDLLEKGNLHLAESEARALYAAFHDVLTGAPNRAAFLKELGARVQSKATGYAVAMLDLDRFKSVNDNFGHAAGDEVVRSVWRSLHAVLPEGSLAARLGGDEFGIILPSGDAETLRGICETLVAVCGEDRSVFGHSVQIGGSVGVAMALPDGERDKIDIVRRADLALYAAKRAGRGRAEFFDTELDESVRFRRQIETGLRRAIAENELALVFQPIVAQETLEVVGFEALVRWDSPEHGPISPALFVPVAEEGMLIHDLADWVVPRALEACKAWPDQYVSINFSPRQFHRLGIGDQLTAAVAAAGLTPDRVQIEITETALFDDADEAARILRELHAKGFRVALDDFGTGYSSLFNLKNFDIDCIKIDRSFVTSLGREPNATAIVTAMVQLARSMGLDVVAEGVEDEFQHQALRLAGCSHMQGYRFGRPKSAADAVTRLTEAGQPDVQPLSATA